MEKYFVQINRNKMVSIEAETALGAEHAFLDLDGIQYAVAYDADMRKTDTFRGALLGCDTMSMDELVQLSGQYREAWKDVSYAKDAWMKADRYMRELKDKLEAAQQALKDAEHEYHQELRIAKTINAALNLEEDA